MIEWNANFDVYPDIVAVEGYARFRVFYSDLISSILYKGEVWEPHMHALFERRITKDSVVLEGGSHIGSHAVRLAMLAKKVYCFEPLEPSRDLLRENLAINGCTNAVVSGKALGAEKGVAYFGWITDENLGGAGLHQNGEKSSVEVEVTTIDALDLPQLDFIKLDVEQYEPLAVAGGMQTIAKFLPDIVLECWDTFPGTSVEHTKATYPMLLDLGYEVDRVAPDVPDFVFIHRDRK